MHVVHISSAHDAGDVRIRRKQIGSLIDNGFMVTFVTGDLAAADQPGLDVRRIQPGRHSRLRRLLMTAPKCILAASRIEADIYHFHDPELIPWAWLLRLKQRPVIYDIHEDYVTSIAGKSYLPRPVRHSASFLADRFEHLATSPFTRVLAERYYERRFPDGVHVLNYPLFKDLPEPSLASSSRERLLYTGNITEQRGALEMARLVALSPKDALTLVGKCSPELAARIRSEAGSRGQDIEIIGEGRYVPFSEIGDYYARGDWLAGLALFPPSDHYREKELTKFFEYMAVGLPIVASNFPVWRQLIEGHGVGLCVNPEVPEEAHNALEWLRNNPSKWTAMREAGMAVVRSKFRWESEAETLIDLYHKVTSSS